MSNLAKIHKGVTKAIAFKDEAQKILNEEQLFSNEQGIKAEKLFEGKAKSGFNKLQQYKPKADNPDNPIAKLIKSFEQMLQNGEPLLSKFSNFYLTKGDLIHLIPRTILLFLSLFIIITEVILLLISPVIEAIPYIGPPLLKLLQSFSLPKEIYFMFYGGIKFILCFTILLSVVILIKEREEYFSASMKDILFLFIVFVINLLPYLYDLLSYIIHLGIMDGFYRYKCQRDSEDNEKVIANKFNLIALLEFGILLIGLISFLYYFLRHYFYPNVKKDDTNPWYIESLPLFMFFVPILYLGILYICNFIEKELSDMVLTTMGSMDEDIPDEKNCVAGPGQCEDSDDNKLTGLLKLFIYGGISFFIVILQRTSLSKAIRNVLEQTITTNIMLIQKIIGINIKVKVKNDKGDDYEIDINDFEENRNISDYSYGKEIGNKFEKLGKMDLKKLSSETLTDKDCENISNLRDIYNSLKKQHELYNDSSPNYNEEKFEKIKNYTKEFKHKLNTISGLNTNEDADIFTDDIFTNESVLKNLIKNCSKRMKELDPNSTFGLNAEYETIKRDIKNNEKEKSLLSKVLKDKNSELDIKNSELASLNQAKHDTVDKNFKNKLEKRIKEITQEIETLKQKEDNLEHSTKSFQEKQDSLKPLAETIQSKNEFDREKKSFLIKVLEAKKKEKKKLERENKSIDTISEEIKELQKTDNISDEIFNKYANLTTKLKNKRDHINDVTRSKVVEENMDGMFSRLMANVEHKT